MPGFITPFADLVAIARDNLKSAVELVKRVAELEKEYATLTGDDAEAFRVLEIAPVENKTESHCLIAIVFSALTIEGYIYYYAIRHFSEDFVDTHLDRLDVVSKWVIVPKLVTGKDFPKDSRAFQLLKQLVANRNYIVLSKSTNAFSYDRMKDDWVLSGPAKKQLDFSREVFQKAQDAVKAIDELALIME